MYLHQHDALNNPLKNGLLPVLLKLVGLHLFKDLASQLSVEPHFIDPHHDILGD